MATGAYPGGASALGQSLVPLVNRLQDIFAQVQEASDASDRRRCTLSMHVLQRAIVDVNASRAEDSLGRGTSAGSSLVGTLSDALHFAGGHPDSGPRPATGCGRGLSEQRQELRARGAGACLTPEPPQLYTMSTHIYSRSG